MWTDHWGEMCDPSFSRYKKKSCWNQLVWTRNVNVVPRFRRMMGGQREWVNVQSTASGETCPRSRSSIGIIVLHSPIKQVSAFPPPLFTLHWAFNLYTLYYFLPRGFDHKLNPTYESIKDITSRSFTGSLQPLSPGPIRQVKNVPCVTEWHPKPDKSCSCHCHCQINGNLRHLNYFHPHPSHPTTNHCQGYAEQFGLWGISPPYFPSLQFRDL